MLPKDPFMLLSYINTQLRDNYSSLDDLTSSLDEDRIQLEELLAKIGYFYEENTNRFIRK